MEMPESISAALAAARKSLQSLSAKYAQMLLANTGAAVSRLPTLTI